MRIPIRKCPVPANTILEAYSMNGAYADCYETQVPCRVAFSEFIFAFYTTPLFKLERWILKLTVAKPSTDMQARQLAEGVMSEFAAWHVEDRRENELLMCDFRGQTRSWLSVAPVKTVNGDRTQLYFGSAVLPIRNPKTGGLALGSGYQILLGFHKVYSVLLLYTSGQRIQHRARNL
jgi:hypothetical protein